MIVRLLCLLSPWSGKKKKKSEKRALPEYIGTRWEIQPVSQNVAAVKLNNLALMGYSRKKSKQGGLRAYVLVRKPPGTFISLLLHPWKFWTKKSLIPKNSTKLCYKKMMHPWNSKTKKQDTKILEFPLVF